MWTDNSTNNVGIFDIFLKTYMANNPMSENIDDDQAIILRTLGSVIRPQMATILAGDADTTVAAQNERKTSRYNLIIAWTEYKPGFYGIYLSRVSL